VAVKNRFYPSNAQDAEHNHAMILSDDVMMTAQVMGPDQMNIMWN